MTHFLAVGFIREALHEILQQVEALGTLVNMDEAQRQAYLRARAAGNAPTTYQSALAAAVRDLGESVRQLSATLEQFESDPVVYTGPGDTATVLDMLERLLAGGRE